MSIFRKAPKIDPNSEGEVCRRRETAIKIIEKELDIVNITGAFMGNRERLEKLILCFKATEDEASIRFIQSNFHQNYGKSPAIDKIKAVGEKLKQII